MLLYKAAGKDIHSPPNAAELGSPKSDSKSEERTELDVSESSSDELVRPHSNKSMLLSVKNAIAYSFMPNDHINIHFFVLMDLICMVEF